MTQSLCLLAQYTTPFIQTPLFISNSAIDMWGLMNIVALGCVPTFDNKSVAAGAFCKPEQWDVLQGWFTQFHGVLIPLLQRNPALGAFIASAMSTKLISIIAAANPCPTACTNSHDTPSLALSGPYALQFFFPHENL